MTDPTGAHAGNDVDTIFDDLPSNIDTDVFSVARLYDFLLGGKHNFAPDRDFGRQLLSIEPNGRMILQQNRYFLARAMKVMLDDGVRQFLDLGSGIPTQSYVHELAHAVDPAARVVYIDNDPPAVSHSNYILRGERQRRRGARRHDRRRAGAGRPHRQVADRLRPAGRG